MKALGHGRMICVMNTAHGEPSAETLPFDMQHLRHPITYHCPDDADEKTRRDARDGLAKTLAHAIRLILDSPEMLASRPSPPMPPIFLRLEEKDGPGRFRAPGEPLGVVDGHRSFSETILDLRLSTGAPAWLRLIPTIDPERRWKWAELKQAGSQAIPLYNHSSGFNYLRASDGFGMFSVAGSEAVTDSVTMVFDTGEIWSADRGTIDAARGDYLPLEEREFVQALQRLTDVARKLGLPGPFRVVAGMAGVRGRGVASPSGYEVIGTSVVDVIVHESDHAYGVEPAASLEPFFDLVFDRCGIDRAEWLKARKVMARQPEITVSYSVAPP